MTGGCWELHRPSAVGEPSPALRPPLPLPRVREIRVRATLDPPGLRRQLPAAFCPSCPLCRGQPWGKWGALRCCTSFRLDFCLCYQRQHLCLGPGDSSPKPGGFSGMTLRAPQEVDLPVESFLHGEGKATAVSQLAERAVCARRRFPLPWQGTGPPPAPLALPHLPPPRALCQPSATCPLRRTPLCLAPALGLPGTKSWRCPFIRS